MGNLASGGGTSVVAASAHAACERYRHTDPLLTGVSRRRLAQDIGYPDISAGIPEARWMRAMTFERLVKHENFVSPLLTTAVGKLRLARPNGVRRADGKVTIAVTATVIQQAHLKAVHQEEATMVTSLAVPFVGMEAETSATPARPDFAIIAPRYDLADESTAADSDRPVGSWLVMGDAKDYERVRTVIDDQRMLKGFLQVALGVESALDWSAIPNGMEVHNYGVLAVPRNAFLQPTAVVDRLDDHRVEVMARVEERRRIFADLEGQPASAPSRGTVEHLEKTYDPGSCPSCSLFSFCRSEIWAAEGAIARLIEIGVRPESRAALLPVVDGSAEVADVDSRQVSAVRATRDGRAVWSTMRRTDPVGDPGTINLVLAKSDSAALGIYGMGIQRIDINGDPEAWDLLVFDDAQAAATRLQVLQRLGGSLDRCLEESAAADAHLADRAVRIVTTDSVTADVLASIADSAAGVEIQRLRWARDLDAGRTPLTFDGEPASIPAALTDEQRLAVSYLLDEDRGRAFTLRQPMVDLRGVLAQHLVPGGPLTDAGRLDLLVEWGEGLAARTPREVADSIEASVHTPGARLSNAMSDRIHQARKRGAGDGTYAALVMDELRSKVELVERTTALLERVPVSALKPVVRELEGSAQAAWRRREALHASDLVRFGRVTERWRNDLVPKLDSDEQCRTKLAALGSYDEARDMARDAGTKEVALAEVLSVDPLRLRIRSRRMRDVEHLVVLHVGDQPTIEGPEVTLKVLKGSFKFRQMPVGTLTEDDATPDDGGLTWTAKVTPSLQVGDDLVVADAAWLSGPGRSGHEIAVGRGPVDDLNGPKATCGEHSYAGDPDGHRWCCRSHEVREAETSDWIAERRAAGKMNPEVWPPLVDSDQFDAPALAGATEDAARVDGSGSRPDYTPDDLD